MTQTSLPTTGQKPPDVELWLQMYEQMAKIRAFEEQVNELYTQAKMPGLAHLYIGEEAVAGFAESVPATPEDIKGGVEAFAAEGCDELILFPTSSDPAHVELLAEAVL